MTATTPSPHPAAAIQSTHVFGRIATKIAIWVILCGGGAAMILPFLWMISSSLKTRSQVWVFRLSGYLTLSSGTTILRLLAACLPYLHFQYLANHHTGIVRYPIDGFHVWLRFSRMRFPGRDALFMVFLSVLMLPAIVTMIPVFVLFTHLGWVNTLKPLIIPPMLGGGPFNVFLFRQFFRTIPNELSDAARMDGCGDLYIYWRIILPLSRPVLATVAIFTFLANWNDFIGPLLYLQSDSKKTISLGLATFMGLYSTNWELMMAAATTVTIPALVLFLFCQRYFVEGVVLTGLQGV